MEAQMNTLKELLTTERKIHRFQLHANTWGGFLGYFMRRNTGYGQRKILNIIHELIELACLAWVMDISFLKSFILIPLGHILINYLQEYHWQLFRYAPKEWFDKKVNPLDIGLWSASALIIASIATSVFSKIGPDPVLIVLFGLRLLTLFVQLGLAPYNARITSLKRIRPNIKLIWTSSILTWIICISLRFFDFNIYYAFIVSILFNSTKIIQEISYFLTIRREKIKLRFISLIPKKFNEKGNVIHQAGALVILHLMLLAGFSIRFHRLHFAFASVLVFFVLAFFDRINSRPLRCLALDFLQLEKKGLYHLKNGIIRRALLLSVILCAASTYLIIHKRAWPLLASSAVFVVAFNGMLNNALMFGRVGTLDEGHTIRIKNIIKLQLISLIPLLFQNRQMFTLFVISQFIVLFASIHALLKEEQIGRSLKALLFQFDWNPILPLLKNFYSRINKDNYVLISLNRRTKIISVPNQDAWDSLISEFPLNLRNWKSIEQLPHRLDPKIPENVRRVDLDFWGFWKYRGSEERPDEDQSLFLHQTSRNWRKYPYLLGGKNSWKAESEKLFNQVAGPIDREGKSLWIR